MKKLISIMLALVMTFGIGVCAFATEPDATPTYTLTFDTNKVKTIESVKLAEDAAIEFPDANVDGYTFNGWYADAAFTTKFIATVMPGEDTTIYASYTKNKYTLTFDTAGKKEIAPVECEFGATITLPEVKVDGYKLLGWFTDKELKTPFTEKTMPAKNVTLYASLVEETKFILTIDYGAAADPDTYAVAEGESIGVKEPAIEDLYFVGLFEDAECTKANTITKMPAKDLTLYGLYAFKLSKMPSFDKVLGEADEEINPEMFKLLDNAGMKIRYTIGKNTYTATSAATFLDEIKNVAANAVKYGTVEKIKIVLDLSAMSGLLGNDPGDKTTEELEIVVYNDIKAPAPVTDPKTDDTTSSSKTDDTSSTSKVDDSTSTTAKKDDTSTTAKDNTKVPATGSSIAMGVIAAIALVVAIAVVVVVVKKKDDEAKAENN